MVSPTATKKGVKGVRSVARALSLLEIMGDGGKPVSLAELTALSELNMSTTYRLLLTLMKAGFVVQDPNTGKYKLSIKTFRIGNAALYSLDLRAEARPFVEELVQACNETANLVALDGDEVVYLDQVESSNMVRMLAKVGSQLPAYCTGGGKALLAYLPESEIEAFYANKSFEKHTDNTITSFEALKEQIDRIRRNGFSLDDEERELGVRCVAAPIRNHEGKVIAAVSVSGPSARLTHDYIEAALVGLVKDCAAKIAIRLGYKAPAKAV
ncbi:MAG: IclR family transcriptional regulator [Firmicutes bacterium]|nr:IclR family transcriptional regulator [Bacillota bacterium]